MSAVCVLPQVGNRSFHSNIAFHYSVIFNLYAVTVYSFCSLSLLYFLYRQKVPKNSAQTKIVALSSARELNKFNIPRSSFACHFNPIYFEHGATKLATRGCTIKITPTLRSNSLAQWPALNRDLRSICLAKLLLLGIVQVNLALLSLTRNFLTVPSYLTLLLQVGNSGQV